MCHVNDCTITRSSHVLIENYKDKLKEKYSLTDLGLANWLLGIKITRDFKAQMISLSKSSYISSMLTQFNFMDLNPFATPMDFSIHFSKGWCPQTLEEATEMSKVPYQEAIGSLNYCVVATQPNIAFSVLLLAQFMENPRCIHREAFRNHMELQTMV